MRRRFVISFVVLLSVLLVVSIAFSAGVVDFSKFSFMSSLATVEPAQASASIFVDPAAVIQDYPVLPVGSRFTVHVNISDVSDLFTWQINMSWNSSILNFSRVKEYGAFLRGTTSPNGTSGWINRDPAQNVTIAPFNNTVGFVAVAESILDSRAGATGVSGSGRLVSIELLVVGYGSTNLTISLSGNLRTTLLNSTVMADGQPGSISFTKTDGYFRNMLTGDANGDGVVDIFDILKVKFHWYPGPPYGAGGYERDVDINDDGAIDIFDILSVKANWGRSV